MNNENCYDKIIINVKKLDFFEMSVWTVAGRFAIIGVFVNLAVVIAMVSYTKIVMNLIFIKLNANNYRFLNVRFKLA